MPSTLAHFHFFDTLTAVFQSVPADWPSFDILAVPPHAWQHLYLAAIEADGAFRVRLSGDALRSFFGRDLRGTDLRLLVHGRESDGVIQAYDTAVATHQRLALKQDVLLPEKRLLVTLECGIMPLTQEDRVVRILGCLMIRLVPAGHTPVSTLEVHTIPTL